MLKKIKFNTWGQVIVAFKKSTYPTKTSENFAKFSIDYVLNSINKFKKDILHFKDTSDLIMESNKNILGFGAAQNFPIFHYFCDGDLPFQTIIDDNPLRQNKVFPYINNILTSKPKLNHRGDVAALPGSDYARVLFHRMGELEFDHIILPFSSY